MSFSTPSSTSGGASFPQQKAQGQARGFLSGRGGLPAFEGYGGDLSALFGGSEQDVLNKFFGSGGAGGDFDLARGAVSDIAEQDAIGRAQLMLEPSLQRSINLGINQIRERFGSQGLFSSGNRALAEGEATGVATGEASSALAGLIPQLTGLKLQAAQALPGMTAQSLGLASVPRLVQQQGLDRLYQEFLRTTPSGGPLQALLALAGGAPGGGQTNYGQSSLAAIIPILAAIAGGAASASDIRLKTNIRPVTWEWRDQDLRDPTIGLIAQDAREQFPDAVMPGANGYLRVNYALLSAKLADIAHKQAARIRELESRLGET